MYIRHDNNAVGMDSGGYIGMGTDRPSHKLHIKDGGIWINGTGTKVDNNSFSGPCIFFGGGTSVDPNGKWAMEYDPGMGLNFWVPWPTPGYSNYYLFLQDGTGNVGINTGTPVTRLSVNGNVAIGDASFLQASNIKAGYNLFVQNGILTERVKVAIKGTSNWSDHVFRNEYPLKPIGELEQFVKENKHLPNIPSAKEMVRNGLDVATMDAKLLEKIEELTLYIIEQNKQLQELKQKNTEFEKRLSLKK